MDTSLTSAGEFALLAVGFLFGLKHATEVDHVVAVSTVVSEQRNVWSSAIVGGLWGAGHTLSLIVVGVLVLVFRLAIPFSVASRLELGVALMIIVLGVIAVARALRRRADVHLHRHSHDGQTHIHIHFHERENEHHVVADLHTSAKPHSHAVSQVGIKPILIGAMHGLAGSAALTLVVLAQIPSLWSGLFYLVLFGVGSTGGMVVMSGLIGLPFAFSGRWISKAHNGLQTVAGGVSIIFGLWYAYRVY